MLPLSPCCCATAAAAAAAAAVAASCFVETALGKTWQDTATLPIDSAVLGNIAESLDSTRQYLVILPSHSAIFPSHLAILPGHSAILPSDSETRGNRKEGISGTLLAHGMQILVLISVAKFGKHGQI